MSPKSEKLWHETEEDIFLNMVGKAYHIISKEVGKIRTCSFNLFSHAFLHIDTQTLTNYVGKMVTL